MVFKKEEKQQPGENNNGRWIGFLLLKLSKKKIIYELIEESVEKNKRMKAQRTDLTWEIVQ